MNHLDYQVDTAQILIYFLSSHHNPLNSSGIYQALSRQSFTHESR